MTPCVSKLLLSTAAPCIVLTGKKDVKYISIKILNPVSLISELHIKNCHHLYLYITVTLSMSNSSMSVLTLPAIGTSTPLTDASAQQCTHLISSAVICGLGWHLSYPKPASPLSALNLDAFRNLELKKPLLSFLSSHFLRSFIRDINFLCPVLFPCAIQSMAVLCHQTPWEWKEKAATKLSALHLIPGRKKILRNMK